MKTKSATAPIAAGLMALCFASAVHAATLPFVLDGDGLATPLFDPDDGALASPATSGNVVVLSGETLTVNTTTGAISKTGTDAFSGGSCTGNTETGPNGSKQIALFTFNSLTVNSGAFITITGTRAAGFIARNTMTIDGTVSVTGQADQNGNTGGPATLAGYAGGAGSAGNGAAGGGIAGFGGTGGAISNGGGGGRTYTDARLIDLLGGSGGGSGGAFSSLAFGTNSGGGGGGGGGLLLLGQTSLTLGPNAVILAKGGNGGTGLRFNSDDSAGGGGGGAGGSVVLCSPGIVLGGQINLAGGLGGTGLGAGNGTPGETGRLAIYSKTTPTGTAAITATRFDNAANAYPVFLDTSLPPSTTLNFIPDSTGAAAPLFDPDNGTLLSPATSGNVTVLTGETLTINSTTGSIAKSGTNSFSGLADTGTTEAATNGSMEVALFTFNNLTVNSGAVINITGTRPVGFIARHSMTIGGTVNVTGRNAAGGGTPGAAALAGYAGGSHSSPGGGIAGFGGLAGTGGTGGGRGGRTYTDARLTDLLGGSGGGSGAVTVTAGGSNTIGGGGGGGGGALLLLAQNSLTLGPQAAILGKGGSGGTGSQSNSDDSAGGGGGGAGGSVVLCAPGIALNSGSQIILAGGTFGTGLGASHGTAGETGRLAIYSKSAPVNSGATITATRFDNTTTAYPPALTLEGEPKPVIVSFTMDGLPGGNRTVTIVGKGTPGASYVLEKGTDLAVWTVDGSSRIATATGEVSYTRTANPVLLPKLFYRLRKL